MSITIGIDVGGSTTKIVGLEDGCIKAPMLVRATDQITSLFGAFGRFVSENRLSLDTIDRVMVTGVGSSYLKSPIYGLKTTKVEEFLANGLGGLHLSGLKSAVIVSMGTGTAMVLASEGNIKYLGGTGIGGGTLMGLSQRILNVRDIRTVIEMAKRGRLTNVDLLVGDLTPDRLSELNPSLTAANLGRISDATTPEDLALGIINLVFQAIGVVAIFAARSESTRDIVLIGNLTTVPQAKEIFSALSELLDKNFIIPSNAEFSTAVGAALAASTLTECISE